MTTAPAQIEDLIRTLEGTEVPAPGRWQVGAGQPVRLTFGGLRRRTTEGRIVAGTLDVTDGIVGSALEITVAVDDGDRRADAGVPTRDPPGTLTFTLAVTGFSASGSWRAVGATTGGEEAASSPVDVEIEYRGVYRHARHTSLWLTVDGDADGSGGRIATRRFRRSGIRLRSELTLHPTAA